MKKKIVTISDCNLKRISMCTVGDDLEQGKYFCFWIFDALLIQAHLCNDSFFILIYIGWLCSA